MSDCKTFEPLLQAYLDDELSEGERGELEEHLPSCAACRGVLGELEALGGHLQGLYAVHERAPVAVSVPGVPAASGGNGRQAAVTIRPSAVLGSGTGPVGGDGDDQQGVTVAGGYRLEHPIAKGGFGTVYRAVQLSMDRPVALKLMAPHLAENQEFVARFLREARVAGTISHPNVVAIYDVGQEGQQLYYSMELVEGEDVEAILKRDGFVPQRRAAEVALGVAKALQAADKVGIIHRDVKPANILVTEQGQTKLADLGLAKAAAQGTQDASLTVGKKVIGSPNYMSPEQGQDMRRADHRSDLYSLGATLLHMIGGRVPFGSGSPVEVLARVLRDPPDVPDVLPDGQKLDPGLDAVVRRCLEKDPAARFADAGELAAALQAYLTGKPVKAATGSGAGSRRRRSSGQGPASARHRRSARARRKTPPEGLKVHAGGKIPPAAFVAAAAGLLVVVGLLLAFGGSDAPAEDVAEESPAPSASAAPGPDASRAPAPDVRGPRRVVADEEAERDEQRRKESALALASLQEWSRQNPDRSAELYHKARGLIDAFPGTNAARVAEAMQGEAVALLEADLAETEAEAEQLEGEDRLAAARAAYAGYVDEVGEDVPTAAIAELAMRTLDAELELRLDEDLAKLQEALDADDADAARELAAAVERYAGAEAAREARGLVDEHLAARGPVDEPEPGPSPEPSPEASPEGEPDAEPEPEPSPLGEEVLAALADARAALDDRDYPRARELLEELREAHGRDLEGLEELHAALRAATEPETDALLAAYLRGQTEVLGARRIRVVFEFDEEDEAEDWVDHTPRDGKDRRDGALMEWLERQIQSDRAPYTVHRGKLLAFGWSRRKFVAPFETHDPIVVDIEAKGGQNMLVSFIRNRERSTHVGFGFLLDDIAIRPFINAVSERFGARRISKYMANREETIARSQSRGPSFVVLGEKGFLEVDEARADAHPKMRDAEFSAALRPADDGHEVAVGFRRQELTVPVDAPDRVQVGLNTFGAAVGYERIVLEGTVDEGFVRRLERAAREVGIEDPEALRREVDEQAEDREGD